MKWCKGCSQERPLEFWNVNKRHKDGLFSKCKICEAERKRKIDEALRIEDRTLYVIELAEKRARKKRLPCDLREYYPELKARLEVGRCEITGVPFEMVLKDAPYGPSIDQIIAGRGYPYLNVRWILRWVNNAFSNWGEAIVREATVQWMANDLTMLAALFRLLPATDYVRRLMQTWLADHPQTGEAPRPGPRLWTPDGLLDSFEAPCIVGVA